MKRKLHVFDDEAVEVGDGEVEEVEEPEEDEGDGRPPEASNGANGTIHARKLSHEVRWPFAGLRRQEEEE
jgi:hypothetical protein